MNIDKEYVSRIAALARLETSPEQAEKFAVQFRDIIGYMDSLNQVDTSGVEPFYSPSENISVLREDETRKTCRRSDILASAPHHDGEYFIVPRII
ncbi:glutamyl-tRNA(Gln) amidotransferase, C subunit [Desulfonatronospira thiodismutans ASO3-1]|uniref:Aspartyl/glutamyl-tRNA(Asn/Gln) amidotransferase subunit C n=1 Tax=Desulfonatronospira thiodismutans ASO3-1 TaxID=555779 RepID=D6SMV5_9BACT|nr:Asp-tRNA(Asn)/Glu-tRNA(Gln) amidotransferase subunit GatC [Desulfonatronospira thiodismutans]EFI36016.1 glutamyl-tRNA(Gln) amidotransferase, C subunit [Desulfonatronospira thiodismutans ASO3-1]